MNPNLAERFFLEAHHYDGGLRFQHYPVQSERPSWAPAPDRVGFRDEIELTIDGVIVEFARIAAGSDIVDWIAVYRRSVDSQLGDRQNHAGIGVWLRNSKIVNPTTLIKGLRNLADPIATNGPISVADDVATFASEKFLPKYLDARELFPEEFAGSPTSSGVLQTKLNAWGASLEKALPLIGCDILSRSVGSIGVGIENRILYFCKDRGTLEADAGLPVFEIYTSLSELVRTVPKAFRSSSQKLVQLQGSLDGSSREVAALREREAQLRSEITAAQGKLKVLEDEVTVRRKDDPITPLVSQNLRQFESRIDSELASFGRNLEAIENGIRNISRTPQTISPAPKQSGERRAVYITEENPWTFWLVIVVIVMQLCSVILLAMPYV